jgi:hypothetical protein
MIQGSRERSLLKKKVADLKSPTKTDNMRTLKFVTLIVAWDTVLEIPEESGSLEMSGTTWIPQDLHHNPNPLTSANIDMHRQIEFQCCLAVACVMAQGELKATTMVVGPFEEGTVARCLTRLKHHCIIAQFSGSLFIPGVRI